MEQSSTDRRVRKTKKQLRLALMELLAEKSAKSISVRELTERIEKKIVVTKQDVSGSQIHLQV